MLNGILDDILCELLDDLRANTLNKLLDGMLDDIQDRLRAT